MAFTTVTITRDYDLADGTDPTGTVSFTPTAPMINGPTVVAAKVTHRLDVDGVLSIDLAASTDPDTVPAGTAYLVEEDIGGATRSYYIEVPHDQGSVVNLATLASIGVAPALSFPSSSVTLPWVNIQDYGAAGNGTTDDSAALATAIAALGSRGGTVQLAAKAYRFENVAVPSNLRIRGAVGGGASTAGTVIVRGSNVPIFTSTGTSFLTGGPQNRNITFADFRIEGGSTSAALFDLKACTGVRWERIFATGTTGQWLKLTEVYDSRVKDCDFEFGGSSDGVTYGIELTSGSGYEYTNQIHFLQCRFESYPGTAVGTKGTNTNEIFFQSCKFESITSAQPHLVFASAASLGFFNVQVTGGGTGGSITTLVSLTSCTPVWGSLLLEMAGSSTRTIGSYLTLTTSPSVDLTTLIYGSAVPTSGFFINWDALNSASTSLRCYTAITGAAPTSNTQPVALTGISSARVVGRAAQEPSLSFQRDDKTDVWSIGRVISDGAGSQFRLLHDSTPILVVQNDNQARWQKTWTHAVATQTAAAGGTVTLSTANANVHRVTLQSNITLAVNSAANGQPLIVELIQDATGGRTVAWPAAFKFAGGTAPTDTTASKRTIVQFVYDSTATTWNETGRSIAVG